MHATHVSLPKSHSRTKGGSSSSTSSSSTTSGTNSLDKILIGALGVLVIVYTLITVILFFRVSDTNVQEVYASHTAASAAARHIQTVSEKIDILQHTFPIHVGFDVEQILHPGLLLVKDQNKIPASVPRSMTVPKFFDESHGHYYFPSSSSSEQGKQNTTDTFETIRHYLSDGTMLLTPELAATIGSYTLVPDRKDATTTTAATSTDTQPDQIIMETIYCSVASYRDPECTGSVEDLYAMAEYPERIRVAILDQRVNGDPVCAQPAVPCEQDPQQALCRYRHLIDVYEMDAVLAVGPVFARHLAHRHYRGEYFAMQIDSHVRFVKHWDSDIVGQWKSANNEMAVLSTYLSDIIGSIDPTSHEGIHKGRPIMCQSDYEGNGANKHLRHGQQPEGEAGIKGQPTLHPFWAAGFSFARGHFVIQVPYDQHLPMVFQGEEISIGLRGFTYGYDYYAAERSVCFHMYAIKENEARRKKVPLFWENSNLYEGTGVKAMKRLNTIIGMGNYPVAEWVQDDRQKYGLGQIRNADKFFKVFGIHVATQSVEHHLCSFVGKPMMKVFLPAMRENHMGLDYDKINYEFVDPTPEVTTPIRTKKAK